MAKLAVETRRFDPYKNFKFRIKWDGKYVAGISKVSGLQGSSEVVAYHEGGDPGHSPFILESGVTHDPEFGNWANLVYNTDGDSATSLKNFRKDLIIELLNEQGTVAKAYKVFRCWVSEYIPLPGLDSSANTVAIESMVLQNEGWEYCTVVTKPTES